MGPRAKKQRRWGLGLGMLVIAVLVQWQLIWSAVIGVVCGLWVWHLRDGQWQPPQVWSQLQSQLQSRYRPWMVAVGVGLWGMVGAYGAIAAWTEAQPWLAIELALQQIGLAVLLTSLCWPIQGGVAPHAENVDSSGGQPLESALLALTDADPLRRLITVRQLTIPSMSEVADSSTHTNPQLNPAIPQTHLIEYLQLMLRQEPEPMVRNAIREGLATLTPEAGTENVLAAGAPPMVMPPAIAYEEVSG